MDPTTAIVFGVTGFAKSIFSFISGNSPRKLQEERLERDVNFKELQMTFQKVQAEEQRNFQAEQGELNRKHQAKLEKARQLEQAKNREQQLLLQELQRNFQAEQNAENRAAQRQNLIKQLEFQRETQLKIKALDAETSFKIRAFDRETALNNIHEQKRLQNLPIVDRPEQYLQGNTQNPDVHIFFAPPTVRHDNRKVTGDLKISEDALARQIRNFLDSYKAAERTNRFHGGGWQTRAIHSETAIEAIFRELKSEPTLIIETFAEAQDYHIRFGFWAPNFPKYQYKEVFSFNWLQVLGDLAKATTLEYEKLALSESDFVDFYGEQMFKAYQNNRDLIAKEAKARKFNLPEDEIQHHILSKYKPFTKNTKQLVEYISLYHNIGAGLLLDQYYLLHAPADQRKKPLLPQRLPELLKGISNEAALTELKQEIVRLYAQLYDCLAEDRYQAFELPHHYLDLAELALNLKSPDQAQLALQKSAYYFLADRNVPQLAAAPETALLFLTDPICCPYLIDKDLDYLKMMTGVLTQINSTLSLSPPKIITPEAVETYFRQEEAERLRKEKAEQARKEAEQRRQQEEAERLRKEKEKMRLVIDGKTYKTVKIGNQIWMAENLNLEVADSCFYRFNPKYGKKYGRLYSWKAAKQAADLVPGWHLPTDEEWDELCEALGGTYRDEIDWGYYKYIGTKLKKDGSSGLDFLLAGGRVIEGGRFDFSRLGSEGNFWSASPNVFSRAWYRTVCADDSNVVRGSDARTDLFSVRLVKD